MAPTRTRETPTPRLVVRLYMAGESSNSVAAKRNLETAVAHIPKDQLTIEFVDVLRDPDRSLRDRVVVTPTLIRVSPSPERRAIGNLRDRVALLGVLGIGEAAGD